MIKKIIWFHPSISQSGGGERLILEGIKYFESVGIDSYLLVFNFNKKATFEGTYNPKVIQLAHKDNGIPKSFLSKIRYYILMMLMLRRKIKEINPDVIISQAQYGQNIPLYIMTLFTPFTHIVHIFGSIFSIPTEFGKYAFIFRRHFNEIKQSVVGYKEVIPAKLSKIGLARRLCIELKAILKYLAIKKAKKAFVLSNQNRWEVKKLYDKDAVVFKGAFPIQIFTYKPKEDIKQKLGLSHKKVILNINRLVSKKRVDLCIKAFKEITNKMENVVLVIGGVGQEEHNLKELVKQLNLEPYVKFVGYIPEKELWDYYISCDVFVQLDIADFNIAPYEALALGKKVVWSTEMEIDEDLKQNRFIFPTNPEVKDTAVVLERALTTDLGSMNSLEKKIMSRYSWDNYFSEILRESERVCKI